MIARDPALVFRKSTDLRDRFRNAYPEVYASCGYKPRQARRKSDNSASLHSRGSLARSTSISSARSLPAPNVPFSAPSSPLSAAVDSQPGPLADVPPLTGMSANVTSSRPDSRMMHARSVSDSGAAYGYNQVAYFDQPYRQLAIPQFSFETMGDNGMPSYLQDYDERTAPSIPQSDNAFQLEWNMPVSQPMDVPTMGTPLFRPVREEAADITLSPSSFSPLSSPLSHSPPSQFPGFGTSSYVDDGGGGQQAQTNPIAISGSPDIFPLQDSTTSYSPPPDFEGIFTRGFSPPPCQGGQSPPYVHTSAFHQALYNLSGQVPMDGTLGQQSFELPAIGRLSFGDLSTTGSAAITGDPPVEVSESVVLAIGIEVLNDMQNSTNSDVVYSAGMPSAGLRIPTPSFPG
jgi:hypothetical protein